MSEKFRKKLLSEIEYTVAPRLFNINHGTASEMEKQIVAECLGFLSLINHSILDIKEIYRLWENSNLKFM